MGVFIEAIPDFQADWLKASNGMVKNPGWKSEVTKIGKNGKIYRLDVVTPSGKFIELKPNTISGRIKGWYQSNVYKKQLGIPGRVIYYNPANPFW